MPSEEEWRRFLTRFHEARPAITERLLDRADTSPYAWLVEPLRRVDGPVVDLACGSAPTRDELTAADWVGVDSSPAELAGAAARGRGPLVLGDATALPFATGAVGAVCAAMSLQVLPRLDTVLAEVTRVLRPGGTIAALTPARLWPSLTGMLTWARVLRVSGLPRPAWPNPRACDTVGRVLEAHGLTVTSNRRHVFVLRMETPADTSLLVDSLYLPGVDEERLRSAQRALAPWAHPGRGLALPLRRVVAHRS
ncbi:class I SAM-dependent methyltransferase [Salinactinospora qingdaonensis]|uniref:Class I SAM-dependent methyltransferase n=1 Tax=Salinactinospora qingdaonensis TaxID=702744 RepID=A0ABP7F5R9_9ACTN